MNSHEPPERAAGARPRAWSLLRHRRGSGNVQMLILTVVIALGGAAGVKLLRDALGGRTVCAGEQIAALTGGAPRCEENGGVPGPDDGLPTQAGEDPGAGGDGQDDGGDGQDDGDDGQDDGGDGQDDGGDGQDDGGDDEAAGEPDPLEELLAIAADIIGLTDAKKCITEGDILACFLTVLNFTPGKIFSIGFKLITKANQLRKAVDKFLAFLAAKRAKKAEEAAEAAENCKGGKCTQPGVCFAPGTPVHTENGPVAIEELKAGDLVWSRDDQTGAEGYRAVVRTFVTPDQPLLELVLADSDGAVETLEVTAPHPFRVQGRGWVAAGDLRVDDEVLNANGGTLRVASLVASARRTTVYNVEVEEFHTYFVGQGAAWVHNQCGPFANSAAAFEAAKKLGFNRRIPPQKAPFNSHGQPVFFDGKRYITPDVDGHNGGVWKVFDRRGRRVGTFDGNLNQIGK